MAMSLGQLCSYATRMAGGRNDYELSEASFWVNQAYSTVYNRTGHTPLEAVATSSTTSGEQRYQLPQDWNYGIAVTLYQGSTSTATTGSQSTTVIRLRQQDANWIDAQTLSPSGVPEAYVQYSSWFELWPSPNSAYSLQLRYAVKPPVLVDSTDTIALDERWHAAVLYKTVELLEASRNNVEGEAMARNRYLSYVVSVPTDQSMKQRDRNGMVLRFGKRRD
jgi:hypothetical protein